MANGIKKGQQYVSKNCKHLRFERIYASRSVVTVAQQLSVVKGEHGRKHQQMAAIVHLLQEGRPMMEYVALRPLFSFLGVPKMPKKQWSDGVGWELADCFYHQIPFKFLYCSNNFVLLVIFISFTFCYILLDHLFRAIIYNCWHVLGPSNQPCR
jgi:hypothetical protein